MQKRLWHTLNYLYINITYTRSADSAPAKESRLHTRAQAECIDRRELRTASPTETPTTWAAGWLTCSETVDLDVLFLHAQLCDHKLAHLGSLVTLHLDDLAHLFVLDNVTIAGKVLLQDL